MIPTEYGSIKKLSSTNLLFSGNHRLQRRVLYDQRQTINIHENLLFSMQSGSYSNQAALFSLLFRILYN